MVSRSSSSTSGGGATPGRVGTAIRPAVSVTSTKGSSASQRRAGEHPHDRESGQRGQPHERMAPQSALEHPAGSNGDPGADAPVVHLECCAQASESARFDHDARGGPGVDQLDDRSQVGRRLVCEDVRLGRTDQSCTRRSVGHREGLLDCGHAVIDQRCELVEICRSARTVGIDVELHFGTDPVHGRDGGGEYPDRGGS